MVERADRSLSLAIFWPHPDFRVSAMAADGSAFGIVTGHRGEGASRYFMELHSVPLRSPVKSGTLVVSSGLGGVWPRGIPIGVVVSEVKTTEGFAKSYLVRPMVSVPDIASVFILTPARARAGVENVWSSIAAADSMRKVIAAVGDSLRKAGIAAADSVRRMMPAAADTSHVRRDSLGRRLRVRQDSTGKVRVKADTSGKPDTSVKPRVKPDTIP
jgi:hypothetical protein